MLDILYAAFTLALFALVAVIAKAIDIMGPRSRGSDPREAPGGGDRR
ncbi:hypothetical protein [Microbacterium sp. 22242]